MRSKSEVIIADALAAHGVDYSYEQRFDGADSTHRLPDFTIEDDAGGETYLWEHLGMLSVPSYRRSWERKQAWYAAKGVLPIEDGGGARAALIVTTDDAAGGIDSAAVHTLIETHLGS